jgi:hypothetical protein
MEDGMQDNILWDDGEQKGERSPSSEYECANEGSWTIFLIN